MDSDPRISPDVLARYAGDAASEVAGVAALAHTAGVSVSSEGAVDVDLQLELEWGRSAAEVGRRAQRRVRDYVERMTNKSVGTVTIVFERVGAPPA
jgi:uncharacterized alkaline shock family protein YloU